MKNKRTHWKWIASERQVVIDALRKRLNWYIAECQTLKERIRVERAADEFREREGLV